MKRLIATLGFMLVGSGMSFGQGTLLFQNFHPTGAVPPAQIFNVDGTTGLTGAGFTAEMWAGPTGGTLALVDSTTFATIPGIFNSKGSVVPTVAGGAVADIQIRVWDNSTGATYDQALIRNQSSIFQVTLATASSPTQPVLVPGLQSFNLQVVPEPSVIALALLGGAALIIRRRKV